MDYQVFQIAMDEIARDCIINDCRFLKNEEALKTVYETDDLARAQMEYIETQVSKLNRAMTDLRKLSNRIHADAHQDPKQLSLLDF